MTPTSLSHSGEGWGEGLSSLAVLSLLMLALCVGMPPKHAILYNVPMPDASLLEVFPCPADSPIVVEHINEEFTSLCPKTGHPDFGSITVRFCPRPASDGGTCVELKSLKLYYQSFRNEGIFYEAVTNQIRDDLVALMNLSWLQVRTDWRGRGGISSTIRAGSGDVPEEWRTR